MNDTGVTRQTEFVFRRLGESFPQFVQDVWQSVPLWLLALAALAVTARIVYRNRTAPTRKPGQPDPVGTALWWAAFGLTLAFVGWFLTAFFKRDNLTATTGEGASALTAANAVMWYVFVGAVFTLGVVFVALMYVKDSRSVRWPWAAGLATLRILVYAILAFVFLLPAVQTWERTEKTSRVVVVLDVSPSVTQVSDETGVSPGRKPKSRLATVIDFLTDEKVEFVRKLLARNPVVVYRFGTRLDEDAQVFGRGDAPWGRAEWEGFASYDFKPFLLRGLSDAGQAALKTTEGWNGDAPGTPDWAVSWATAWKAAYERQTKNEAGETVTERVGPNGMPPEDVARVHDNVAKLEKRVEVARSIALGTNVPDSLTAVVNREATNLVQGIVVFSDGRSNLGSDAAIADLRDRAKREQIPVFTVAVGEDRPVVGIAISDVQAPENTPPEEAFKVVVEADGTGLANQSVEVTLGLYLPGKDPKQDPPDHVLQSPLTFLPGDPPHGQAEFLIDPAKLPDTLTEDSTDAATKKRVLKEGAWAAVARIARHPKEAFPDPEHVRVRDGIQVIRKPLRVLLVASGPSREYQAVRTLFAREVRENRAELCVLLQNEGGQAGAIVQDVPASRLLVRFPTRLDTTRRPPPKTDQEREEFDKERFYNLNEYDLIIAFDPDWSELSQQQAEDLQRWVQEQGGGLIYVASPLNTFQLARVEPNSRLSPILDILPVVPADIHVVRSHPIPRTPRRLYLRPIPGSDLLKLDDAVPDDPVAGWERFFTGRDKYAPDPDQRKELFPRRGFLSCYPVKEDGVKPGAAVLAEFADREDNPNAALNPVNRPWLVTNNPSAGWRTCFMAAGEMYRTVGYDRELFNTFWVKLAKYMAGKRNVKAARGRILISKEYASGGPIRVQARVLDPSSRPYPQDGVGSIDPKFRIVQVPPGGGDEKVIGIYPLTPKPGPSGFDGYYQGQVMADPAKFPPGEFRYRVVVDVPDSVGEALESEFAIRRSDPEMDNTRPDFAALLAIASEADTDFAARLTNPLVRDQLLGQLPRDGGVPKLAFRLGDRDLLGLIPECMPAKEQRADNRGPVTDLWDKGITLSTRTKPPLTISYILLVVVGLLSAEWLTRKLLRLA